MVRQARPRCESCVYHVVLRGINRGEISLDDNDYLRFLETQRRKRYIKSTGFTGTVYKEHKLMLQEERPSVTGVTQYKMPKSGRFSLAYRTY